jgi:predicted amidophosphoribosyltransferase
MEPVFGRFRNRVRRQIHSVFETLGQLLAARRLKNQDFGSQRMCPFCGLITPRSKRLCLECGKSLRSIPVPRKDATQE